MQNALNDLKASTGQIRSVLQDIILSATPTTLSDPKVQRANRLVQNATPVVLSGHLESFLRACSKGFMLAVFGKSRAFAVLPPAIQRCHYKNGGRVLHKLQQGQISWATCTPEDLVTRLASAVTTTPSLPVWEAFGDTENNPSPRVIKRFLEDLGVDKPAERVDVLAGSGRKWAEISPELQLLIDARNICAHAGQHPSPPSASALIENCNLLDELAERIVAVLTERLVSI
jgi:hypothetical protein